MTPTQAPAASPVLRLVDVPRRSRAVVVRLRVEPAAAERLHSVGLGVGAEITVIRGGMRPTVRVGASRLGLGPDLARAIEVRALAGPA